MASHHRPRTFVFRNRRYRIVYKEPPPKMNADGSCDAPDTKGKTINLSPDMHGIHLMRVAIDEGLHACMWDLDNDSVAEIAESISNFLHALGFRRVEP